MSVDVEELEPAEQLELIEKLWESLSKHPENISLTDAQRAELDRRLDELDRTGPVGIPWEEVQNRIRNQKR